MSLLAARTGADSSQPVANGFIPVGLVASNTASGAAFNTYTAATNIEPTALAGVQGFNATPGLVPANHLNQVGKVFRIKAGGMFGVTGTPNFTFAILMGTTVIATTGVQAGAAATSMTFNAEVTCVVTATGASGTVLSTGWFQYFTTAPVAVTWRMTNTTAGTADTVDLTADKQLHLQGTWSASSASNTTTVNYFTVEFLN